MSSILPINLLIKIYGNIIKCGSAIIISVTFPSYQQSVQQVHVSTEVYSGPLDLLLQLIEKAELDITRLSLAKITDNYLDHLRHLEFCNPFEVSAFLVIAAKLVLIKSLVLLPSSKPMEAQFEEDPGETLAKQLLLYKRFKEISLWLKQRERSNLRTYLRSAPIPNIQQILEIGNLNTNDLVNIYLNALSRNDEQFPLSHVVVISTISLREKIQAILNVFKETTKSSFQSLLSTQKSRLEIIVTFLALLELIKNHTLAANQEDVFSDISLECVGGWSEDFETEL